MSQITWKEILIFLGGALAVYYLYIALVYYRKELMGLFRGTGKPGSPPPPPTIDLASKKRVWQVQEVNLAHSIQGQRVNLPQPDNAPQLGPQPPSIRIIDDQGPLLHTRYDEAEYGDDAVALAEMESLQAVITAIRDLFSNLERPVEKELLLEQLQAELQPYPNLTAQPYKIAINNLIITETRERFDLHLTEREMDAIWPPANE